MTDISTLFSEAVRLKASDLHLIAGYPSMLRIDGKLKAVEGSPALSAKDIEDLVFQVLLPEQKELLLTNKEVDFSLTQHTSRFRSNLYYQKGSIAADFRLIPNKVDSIDELGFPRICHEFVKLRQGLVLVTGPTGQGKSTALAAMVQQINETTASHIITIEDPIEYLYSPALSIVSQREMHQDTHSWGVALRSVLREDPDVVLIGEMRDFETIAAAITIAETGHLVFATLHTNSAAQTIDRIVDVFPENQQSQVKMQLAAVLEGVLSLRLIPAIAGGRVPVAEILTGTPAVRTTIREGKSHLIDNVIQTSAELGMMSLEMALANAVKNGKVAVEVATTFALRPEEFARLVRH